MLHRWQLPHVANVSLRSQKYPEPFAKLLEDTYYRGKHPQLGTEKDPIKEAQGILQAARKLAHDYLTTLTIQEGSLPEAVAVIEQQKTQAQQALQVISQAVLFIVSLQKGVQLHSEAVVLSSSWLASGLVAWNNSAIDETRYYAELYQITSQVNAQVALAVIASPILIALGMVRVAFLLLPPASDIEPADEGNSGNLSVTILKRYAPNKVYGPYKYPNVPKLTWDLMKAAVGSYGTGAGTVFWRQYLTGFYRPRSRVAGAA